MSFSHSSDHETLLSAHCCTFQVIALLLSGIYIHPQIRIYLCDGQIQLTDSQYCHIWQMFHLQHFVLLKRIQTARYQELQSTVWILNEVFGLPDSFCYRSNYICWPPEDKATQVFFYLPAGSMHSEIKKRSLSLRRKLALAAAGHPSEASVQQSMSLEHKLGSIRQLNRTF